MTDLVIYLLVIAIFSNRSAFPWSISLSSISEHFRTSVFRIFVFEQQSGYRSVNRGNEVSVG